MDIYSLKYALGVVSALLHGWAYLLYNLQVKSGDSIPNPASWSVWAFLAILNAFTFNAMTADLPSAFQFFMGSVACFLTFAISCFTGKLKMPSAREWRVIVLSIIAAIVWQVFKAADWASLIILGIFLYSFVPTYDGVKDDPEKERAMPWVIWTIAFGITIFNKSLGEPSADVTMLGKIMGFAFPVILLLVHCLIAFLSREERKQRFAA